MIRKLALAALILGVLGFAAFWFLTIPQTVAESALTPHAPNLDNGKTVFYAGGCASCHQVPGQEDQTRLGGGLSLKTPVGIFYMPNISSDAKDGIGAWTEAQFVTAMTKGTSPDRRHYFPAFPYTSYQRLTREDLGDLFAYLKTLPAVEGRVRDHQVPFPFNVRRGIGLWKLLYLRGGTFAADPSQSPQWNRGAYLVNGPGHCAECHSPRDIFAGIVEHQRFAGGPNPDGEGWVPNITQFALKDWSAQDIAVLLETGETPSGDFVGGQMAPVVKNTRNLSAEDRAAMGAYVKSLAPVEGPRRAAKK